MADSVIIEHLIARPGQSQDQRLASELASDAAPVDARTPVDQLGYLTRLASLIQFHQRDGSIRPDGWAPFFRDLIGDSAGRRAAELLASNDGKTAPHLALLLAFLKLYETPRAALNQFSDRHLEFFYRRVLGFQPRLAVPDIAHLLIELKKQTPPTEIGPDHAFSAGKDATQVELVFVPTGRTVVSGAAVQSLRSVFLDRRGHGVVRVAPIANSADGLGGEFAGEPPHWKAFGHQDLSPASIGFALASPVLRLKEGVRHVTLQLVLGGASLGALSGTALQNGLEIFFTGEKGWLGPYVVTTATVSGNTLLLSVDLPAVEPAVVDYQPDLHGPGFGTQSPVVQVLLTPEQSILGLNDFHGMTVQRARIDVAAEGITGLTLESDAGVLDPKKAFLPFGPEPVPGSRFMIGYEEALRKQLTQLTLHVTWQGGPEWFSSHYASYSESVDNEDFTARAAMADGGGVSQSVQLFNKPNQGPHTFSFTLGAVPPVPAPAPDYDYSALEQAGSRWSWRLATRGRLLRLRGGPPVTPLAGFLVLSLDRDFLHAAYRRESVANALKFGKSTDPNSLVVLNEPYTPRISSITLDYAARSDEVPVGSDSLSDFTNPAVQFYHVGCYGRMREHGYQRRQFDFVVAKDVPLLPTYDQAGELMVGVAGLEPDGSVSLLFQVSEGSADPDLPHQDITWWALCDNYWRKLGAGEVSYDTTDHLLRSGVIHFTIPAVASNDNSILPPGLIWLRATVPTETEAVSELVTVAANAVEVRFQDRGNDPARLAAALPAATIAKLKSGPPSIKTVMQPFPSFGGVVAESVDGLDPRLTRRASERLRHKGRCVTPWDYERMVLETFPAVHRVKCISHSRDGVWLAPGHVLLVVVPDLRNQHARDPLRPKVDADTVERIRLFTQHHTGMQVQIHVKNPRYQGVKVDFAVKLRAGFEFNYYSAEVSQRLIEFLSPWAYEPDRPLTFGGQVYRSVLLNFVEDHPAVDYVTDFRMFSFTGASLGPDRSEALPESPDAILVSAPAHNIQDLG